MKTHVISLKVTDEDERNIEELAELLGTKENKSLTIKKAVKIAITEKSDELKTARKMRLIADILMNISDDLNSDATEIEIRKEMKRSRRELKKNDNDEDE